MSHSLVNRFVTSLYHFNTLTLTILIFDDPIVCAKNIFQNVGNYTYFLTLKC